MHTQQMLPPQLSSLPPSKVSGPFSFIRRDETSGSCGELKSSSNTHVWMVKTLEHISEDTSAQIVREVWRDQEKFFIMNSLSFLQPSGAPYEESRVYSSSYLPSLDDSIEKYPHDFQLLSFHSSGHEDPGLFGRTIDLVSTALGHVKRFVSAYFFSSSSEKIPS